MADYSAAADFFIVTLFCDIYFKIVMLKYFYREGGDRLQTLYIDVYFLINFTVNVLALYFSALLSKIESSVIRLLVSSAIGSLFACGVVLLDLKGILFVLALVLSAFLINIVFCVKAAFLRRFKFFSAFILFEALIGGMVNFLYSLLDKYLYPKLTPEEFGAENRSILLLALMILFCFGVVKILFYVFKGTGAERNTSVKIVFYGEQISATALIDTGNLATDPMSSKPVVFVKKELMSPLLGGYGDLSRCDDPKIKIRFRLIPIKGMGGERLLVGLRCDRLLIGKNEVAVENVVIALDEDEGSYGGHKVLMPSAIAEEI